MTTQILWEKYAQEIRKYIAARIDGPAVDDILQQVFLKAHKKIDSIKVEKATKSWLYRIAQFAIIDWYRQEHGDKHGHMSDEFWDQLETAEQTHKQKLTKRLSSCLLPMIKNLDQQSKNVMELYLDSTKSQKMIANELQLSISNIKVIIHRAKKELKNMYHNCCHEYRDEQGFLIDTWCNNPNCGCDAS